MYSFLISLAVLIGGYFIYGTFVEKVFGIDKSRKTPAYTKTDGVDYIPLPAWKIFLIQFLNIAGLGPIFGAIMGVMFGPAAFLWIVLGTIFAGAVHDFLSGMISLRSDGASLPEIVGTQLGLPVKQVMRIFSLLLMILVGAVFVINPAVLLGQLTGDAGNYHIWIYAIFGYYILATLLPIDKFIGNIYPVFGLALLFMAVGVFVMLFDHIHVIPEFSEGLYNRQPDAEKYPIFPMMFISIACGAISGFHATQSPMMARCMKNEKYARPIFYGAMVTEGIVALIWAAAAIAFAGSFEGVHDILSENNGSPAVLVNKISRDWLGVAGGLLAMLGVIAAPITSGDTALRSARLIAADFLRYDQSTILKRLIISLPIFLLSFIVMQIDFTVLWRYFAWCNQTLAVFTLWALTVYLAREGKAYVITLVPALFMSVVTVSYIFMAPEGFELDDNLAIIIGTAVTIILFGLFLKFLLRLKDEKCMVTRS